MRKDKECLAKTPVPYFLNAVPLRESYLKQQLIEWLDEIEKGDSAFLAMVEESIGEREREKFVEGLNSKVKLTLSKCFGKEVQFKKYLHDAGTRLL